MGWGCIYRRVCMLCALLVVYTVNEAVNVVKLVTVKPETLALLNLGESLFKEF